MPPAPRSLVDLLRLEGTNAPRQPSFADFLTQLYDARYSGQVVLHCENGVPRVVEIPQPVKIRLATAS